MAKMSTQHHISTSAHFVSSSAVIARLSAQSQIPVEDPVSSSSSNPVPNAYNYTYQFDGKMAIVILIVASIFLLLGVFAYCIKKCFAPPAIPTRQPAVDRRPGQKNEGLDLEFIETFPVVAYSAASMAKNCTECTVCLMEFQEGERTRLLPRCNHAFHPECIEMWLFSHSTCPLCRTVLISESHTITILSNPSQGSTRHENLNGAVPVMEVGIGAPLESSLGLNDAVERAGEREDVLALSRSSQSCGQETHEMGNRERSSATSASPLLWMKTALLRGG